MANPKRGNVATDIELDGIPLTLRFGTNEIVGRIEELAPSRRFLRAALYAAISRDKRFSGTRRRDATMMRIGDMLDKVGQDEMSGIVKDLLRTLFLAFGVDMDAAVAEAEAQASAEASGDVLPLDAGAATEPSLTQ